MDSVFKYLCTVLQLSSTGCNNFWRTHELSRGPNSDPLNSRNSILRFVEQRRLFWFLLFRSSLDRIGNRCATIADTRWLGQIACTVIPPDVKSHRKSSVVADERFVEISLEFRPLSVSSLLWNDVIYQLDGMNWSTNLGVKERLFIKRSL